MKRKEYIQSLDKKELAKFLADFSLDNISDWWCTEGRCPNKRNGSDDCILNLEETECPYERDEDVLEIWLDEEV